MFFGKGRGAGVEAGRREFPRLGANCVVDFRRVNDDEGLRNMGNQKGFLQNISGGGVCVSMAEAHQTGDLLALNIHLPGFPSSVLACGQVKWCTDDGRGGHEVGIEFWWVGWDDQGAQEQIRDYISGRLRGGPDDRED